MACLIAEEGSARLPQGKVLEYLKSGQDTVVVPGSGPDIMTSSKSGVITTPIYVSRDLSDHQTPPLPSRPDSCAFTLDRSAAEL